MSAEWEGERELQIVLTGLIGLADMTPVFEDVLDEAVAPAIQEEFDTEGRGGWPKLSDARKVQKRRLYGDRPILQASRTLVRSLTEKGAPHQIRQIGPTEALYGTDLAYARFHHAPKSGSRQKKRRILNDKVIRERVRKRAPVKFKEQMREVVRRGR